MKLLVIFTGGTIGSTVSTGYISTDKEKKYKLIDGYLQSQKNHPTEDDTDISFDISEPYTLLSENLTGEYLNKLGQCILGYNQGTLGYNQGTLDYNPQAYDGIILTHGTDTLQYTAAALAYHLISFPLPIVIVSSNYVLEDSRANGAINFSAAVSFLKCRPAAGVYIAYQNSDQVTYLHKGERVLPHLPYTDDVYSIYDTYLGTVDSRNDVHLNTSIRSVSSGNTDETKQSLLLKMPTNASSGICRISPYPGMLYPALSDTTKAILLDTYHSGTICGFTPNMEEFFDHARKLNLPVFLTGANHEADYESVKMWEPFRIHVLPPASPISMYMKLWLLLSTKEDLSTDELVELMSTNIAEEFVE